MLAACEGQLVTATELLRQFAQEGATPKPALPSWQPTALPPPPGAALSLCVPVALHEQRSHAQHPADKYTTHHKYAPNTHHQLALELATLFPHVPPDSLELVLQLTAGSLDASRQLLREQGYEPLAHEVPEQPYVGSLAVAVKPAAPLSVATYQRNEGIYQASLVVSVLAWFCSRLCPRLVFTLTPVGPGRRSARWRTGCVRHTGSALS